MDFATFPGAILLTRNETQNIEYLYRGRLFTTDNFVPQGVIKIKNNDFTPLVNSALSARGFKKGQHRQSIKLGCSEEVLSDKMDELILNMDKYKKIIILPTEINTVLLNKYFDALLSQVDKETFVISLSEMPHRHNSLVINSAPDFYMLYRILEKIQEPANNYDIGISVFISKCDKHTISNILNLKKRRVKNIFLSKCTPIMLNPTLTETLKTEFDIKPTTTAIEDIKLL